MKVGLYIKWSRRPLSFEGNVLGDRLYAESLSRSLRKILHVSEVEIFSPDYLPNKKIDVMVYLNDTKPISKWAKKHVLYLQNGYNRDASELIKEFQAIGYDGYVFFSLKMLEIHESLGYQGIFLPFGVDLELFYPRQPDKKYTYDLAYIGNDIKGAERTKAYLLPAVKYNFGLFGNWKPQYRLRFWRNWRRSDYGKVLEKISQGKIPQEDVSILYSTAKVNLNCTLQCCVDWDVISLRTYEVLACKGFLISDIVPIAQKTMEDCMVFTKGGDDLIAKIDYYLTHEKERKEIAQNGYEYVTKKASIDLRAREFFRYLESIL